MTYRPRGAVGVFSPSGQPIGGDSDASGVTVMLHHSMVELPREPMKPRRYDDRVGFFNETFEDYWKPEAGGRPGLCYHPLAAREKGPEGGDLPAQETDRLFYRSRGAGKMAALDQEGGRGVAAGL